MIGQEKAFILQGIQGSKIFILFGSKCQYDRLEAYLPVSTFGNLINCASTVRNFDVRFDFDFESATMAANTVVGSCIVH